MTAFTAGILDHHQDAARMWSAGGKEYDNVSFAISDALAHAAQRLNAKRGQSILDVATGTGLVGAQCSTYGCARYCGRYRTGTSRRCRRALAKLADRISNGRCRMPALS